MLSYSPPNLSFKINFFYIQGLSFFVSKETYLLHWLSFLFFKETPFLHSTPFSQIQNEYSHTLNSPFSLTFEHRASLTVSVSLSRAKGITVIVSECVTCHPEPFLLPFDVTHSVRQSVSKLKHKKQQCCLQTVKIGINYIRLPWIHKQLFF